MTVILGIDPGLSSALAMASGDELHVHDMPVVEVRGKRVIDASRLAACRYFDSPVTLHQFTVDGFVTKVLGGQYDSQKTPKGAPAADERPRAVGWSGSDAARLQATIEKQRATAGGPA